MGVPSKSNLNPPLEPFDFGSGGVLHLGGKYIVEINDEKILLCAWKVLKVGTPLDT